MTRLFEARPDLDFDFWAAGQPLSYPTAQPPFLWADRAFIYAFRLGWAILGVLGQLITGALGLSAVGGPVTTIAMTAEIARTGFRNFMEIVCLLGVNLAVFNLLPIPALDGSRMIFTTIEWIRGKPVKRSVEAAIHTVGLLALFAFVIVADVYQFFV